MLILINQHIPFIIVDFCTNSSCVLTNLCFLLNPTHKNPSYFSQLAEEPSYRDVLIQINCFKLILNFIKLETLEKYKINK